MTAIWPARIPWRLNRSGANLPYADARRRFETADGPGKLRKRLSLALRPLAGAIEMTAAEHAWFEAFWRDDTAGGVLPFWFPDPLRHRMPLLDGTALAPLLDAAGAPLLIDAWLLCQFGPDAPSPQPLAGGRLRVALSLVALP